MGCGEGIGGERVKRLTPVQQKVMDCLQAGEFIYWSYVASSWWLSGGSRVLRRTYDALLNAKLIRPTETNWVAAEKGHGDGT